MNQKAIEVFGSREDIREMTDRLINMMPGTNNLTQKEALTVAQVAVAHGLDPFTGEVWGIKSATGKWYGVMVGIAGRRKLARRQADQEGGTYWTEPPKLVAPELYNAPANAVVYEVVLHDTVTTQAYAKSIHTLTTAGIPYKDAIAMMGPAPSVIGVGIATPDEQSKMDLHSRAKKRAESYALKQRFDIELKGVEFYDESDLPNDAELPGGDIVDAEIIQETEPKRSEDEIMRDFGFEPESENGTEPKVKELSLQEILVDEGISQNVFAATKLLNTYVPEKIRKDHSLVIAWGKIYRGWRDMGKDVEEAAELADKMERPS